jgi:ethanolamine utilization protein EutQ
MARQLFTAADIRRIHAEQKSGVLVLGPQDLITPEATDLAKEYGMRLIREEAPGSSPMPTRNGLPPLRVVSRAQVALDSFGENLATPGANVRLKDVITSGDGAPVAAGYMAMERGEFPWTLTYDEVDVVLEGELVITRGQEQVRGGPGDCIFIPKGSKISFGTPTFARFVYVTYPADWST